MSYSPAFRGSSAKGSSTATGSGYQNASGSTFPIAAPVSTNGSGQTLLTDVSSESSVEKWVGLTSESTPNGANGQVAGDGRLQNIPLGLGFSVGDPIWVGLSGTLTKQKPDTALPGWGSGFWILFVGVVVKNEFNPSNQDIQLCRQIIGQL